ncbi:MAG TPA: choice-of-anchor tandem repeat NxxGxxAF-containing protein [Candidatus Binataceae bacterium]|nr:choice-of-anchor tandem repeat NxxGxxAF-containing protein [Candidatus Binataceae bacterium]
MARNAKWVLLAALALGWIMPGSAAANPGGYSFTRIAALGDTAPGGGTFIDGFEPTMINSRGDVTFGTDLTVPDPGDEGIFLIRNGKVSPLVLPGESVAGGGVLDSAFHSPFEVSINDNGDVALDYYAAPLPAVITPFGLDAGIYRFSRTTNSLTPVIVPNSTAAPGGGTFVGSTPHPSINNRGEIAFAGMLTDADIDPGTPPGFDGLGVGVFLQKDKSGSIVTVVRPGDLAPGGATFDYAQNPWINDAGDIAFGAHLAGETCIDFGNPQSVFVQCAESIYVKRAARGSIESIAHQGDPAPGGGTFDYAFGPILNSRGDIVFVGDLTPPPNLGSDLGIFLRSGGMSIPVARPGDAMPGGGHLLTVSFFFSTYGLNNRGDVSFLGAVDTDVNGDGLPDIGLFVWSHGVLHLVARTGTVIPGVGTVANLNYPAFVGAPPADIYDSAAINDSGEVLFDAMMADGSVVLLIAKPQP